MPANIIGQNSKFLSHAEIANIWHFGLSVPSVGRPNPKYNLCQISLLAEIDFNLFRSNTNSNPSQMFVMCLLSQISTIERLREAAHSYGNTRPCPVSNRSLKHGNQFGSFSGMCDYAAAVLCANESEVRSRLIEVR